MSMQSRVPTGVVVAGFRVVSLLGEGATGTVYLAEDVRSRERVALKLLHTELAGDERFRRHFLRESKVIAGVDHAYVVRTRASGDELGVLYLAMTYVEGSDLRSTLAREGRLDPQRALRLLADVASALDAAHAAGIVHRDVKPGNILVASGADGEHAYICDFGLARHVSSVGSLTGDRGFVGTLDYVSPEQIDGSTVDARADVYSLGCVLFECLAGRRPFERESELAVVYAHMNDHPPPICSLVPDLPETLDDVLAMALAKSAGERHPTCGALIEAVRAALAGEHAPMRLRRARRRVAAVGVSALAVVAVALVGAVAASHDHSRRQVLGHSALALRANAINFIVPSTRRVAARASLAKAIGLNDSVGDIVFAGGSAWALLVGEQRLDRLGIRTRRSIGTVALPWGAGARLADGSGSVWATEDGGTRVVGIDDHTGKITRRFAVSGTGPGIAFGAGSLWLARDSALARVDPRTGRELSRIPLGHAVTWVTFADGAVWAASAGDGVVAKIDPVHNHVSATANLHPWLSDLTVGGGFVWASSVPDGVVYKLSEDGLDIQGRPAELDDPERLSFGRGGLWITRSAAKTLSVLDAITGAQTDIRVGSVPSIARFRAGLVWTASAPGLPALPRIAGPELRISIPKGFIDADPSQAPWPEDAQLADATCSNLLRVTGTAPGRLEPEIAMAMPVVSSDGRTYTFTIRGGIKFSPPSDEEITAATFKHTIERALSPRLHSPPGLPFASDIAGLGAFRSGRAAHISGIAARGNTLSITLVAPAGDFLTRLSLPYFCPVPLSEKVVPSGLTGPIPSAGPYYTSSISDNRTVLLRNPAYHGSRPRRAERIVYTVGLTATPRAVALTDRGALDYLPPDWDRYSPLAAGGPLDRRSTRGRYALEPAPGVFEIVFGTRRPLFHDLRLRRAVDLALNRPALAAVIGATPAEGYVPPAVTGTQPLRVGPAGRAALHAARKLVAGRRPYVLVGVCGGAPFRKIAEIVRGNLARIGLTLALAPFPVCDPRSAARVDLRIDEFGTPERDPAPFVEQALAAAPGGLRLSPAWRHRVALARAMRGAARDRAYASLAHELSKHVPFIVFASDVTPEYFSRQIGCKVFPPAVDLVELGALCRLSPRATR